MRRLHRWPGLIAALFLSLVALSGAALSVYPALEVSVTAATPADLSVAVLAERVQTRHPGIEQIQRAPSGRITAWWFENGLPGSAVIDPASGADLAPADPDTAQRWLTNLHRSLFLGDGGRLAVAAGAVLILGLALSGAALVARRLGGWRRWFAPLRGPLAGRLHSQIARGAVLGLALSALTALLMAAQTFELLVIEPAAMPASQTVSGLDAMPPGRMPALLATPVSELRELTFPYPDDAADVFTLTTVHGHGTIDQGTGEPLAWTTPGLAERASALIYLLHTGQGAALLGLILGLGALSVPVLGVSGALVWWAGRPRQLRGAAPAARASTVILVGSEGGSTWGFAASLQRALMQAGESVHVGPMAGFDPRRHGKARRFILMAATYGEGEAPAGARGFAEWLERVPAPPDVPMAILGFGDRSFAGYCAYALALAALAQRRGWDQILPPGTIDRQSPQEFAVWGRALGEALGLVLDPVHVPTAPRTQRLTLIARQDYGAEVQAPAAILRFALPPLTVWQRLAGQGFARFQPGDLLGIVVQGGAVPRLYSLASGARDEFVEIVVRKHPGGLASGALLALALGDSLPAFVRRNPRFHAGRGRRPLILIGAGTGIGPLSGIIRANARRRPVQLYFGLRHKSSDFFYREALEGWQQDGRLNRLVTACSRGETPRHVQDALRVEGRAVATAIQQGARIMVCGGREMARGVHEALAEILAPIGLTPARLKSEGRYVEDVY